MGWPSDVSTLSLQISKSRGEHWSGSESVKDSLKVLLSESTHSSFSLADISGEKFFLIGGQEVSILLLVKKSLVNLGEQAKT